jgi:molybdopterin-containing oxidoreductase family membrane subunit
MLGTGMLVCYGYFCELWMALYSHSIYEVETTMQRMFGPYGWSYWVLLTCNLVTPQLLWSKRIRHSEVWLFAIAFVVQLGMWFERYVIVITLTRDHLPSSWGRYAPTEWDYLTAFGSLGLFLTAFTLFVKFLPTISITEMRELLPHTQGGRDGHSVMENAK